MQISIQLRVLPYQHKIYNHQILIITILNATSNKCG
jgi:hypothetical protein